MRKFLLLSFLFLLCSSAANAEWTVNKSGITDDDVFLFQDTTASAGQKTGYISGTLLKNYVLSDVINFSVTAPITYSNGVFSIATNTYHPYDPYLFSWPDTISRDEVLYLNGLTGNIQSQIDALNVGTLPFLTSDPTNPSDDYAWINTTDASFNWVDSTGTNKILATHTAWDTTIDTISFTPVTGATIGGAQISSNAVGIAGINRPSTIAVSGDIGASYKINSGSIVTSSGTVASGDSVTAYVNPAGTGFTETVATITIGGVAYPFSVTTAAAVSSLFSSDFEGTTDRNQWTISGTPDLAYPSAGLSMGGSYVAHLPAGGSGVLTKAITASSDATIIGRVRQSAAFTASRQVYRFLDSGQSAICTLQISTTSTPTAVATDGALFSSAVTADTINGSVWFKLHYKAGSGTNGECGVSKWTGSSWSNPTPIANSAKTANAAYVRSTNYEAGGGASIYIDDITVVGADFTGDPNTL